MYRGMHRLLPGSADQEANLGASFAMDCAACLSVARLLGAMQR